MSRTTTIDISVAYTIYTNLQRTTTNRDAENKGVLRLRHVPFRMGIHAE